MSRLDLDTLLQRLASNRHLRRVLIPPLRAYIRYGPFPQAKRTVWDRVVEPYLAWESHRYVASTAVGTRLGGDTSDLMQQFIYYFGLWEPHVTRWIAGRLGHGDGFVDVGANLGYYSLLAAKRVGPSGRVVSIEPAPEAFALLRSNIERNRARNVRPVNLAAWDSEGVLRLFRGVDYNAGETSPVEDDGFTLDCEVAAAPLGVILRPEEVEGARLIKIDVEGGEGAVLDGMNGLLDRCRRDVEFIVEIHPKQLARSGKRPEDLLAFFAAAGFSAYRIEDDGWSHSYMGRIPRQDPVPLEPPVEEETIAVFSRAEVV